MKALINFSRMKDDELVVLTNTIITAMANNVNFTAPVPSLTDVQVLLDDFSTKLMASRKRGSPEDTALKNESRIPLCAELQKLGYYVNSIAQGQLSTLLSSGFPTNGPQISSLVPLRVEHVVLRDGRQSGQVRLDFAKQKNIRIYEYSYRRLGAPDQDWSDRLTTTSSQGNIIAPLVVGAEYEVQVRAVNTQGSGDWSVSGRILVR